MAPVTRTDNKVVERFHFIEKKKKEITVWLHYHDIICHFFQCFVMSNVEATQRAGVVKWADEFMLE